MHENEPGPVTLAEMLRGQPHPVKIGGVPVTVAATFCATLVDEWVRGGVLDAVVAPGSRSTPLALALAANPHIRVHVHHDERSASFMALGLAMGRPTVLVSTSGTAAAEFHAAVIEAHQAEVPLIVCTADRPPELRDTGSPQTIDQLRLYGPAVRWFHDSGVPATEASATWRALAARSVFESSGPRPGPVHLNLPFREPLVGDAGPLPPGRPKGAAWMTGYRAGALDDRAAMPEELIEPRGVIIAGRGAPAPSQIHELAARLGWPVLADHVSGCRVSAGTTISAFDSILRNTRFAADHRPKLVLRFGAPLASKVLGQWLANSGATHVVVGSSPAWNDPELDVALRIDVSCEHLARVIPSAADTPWLTRWRRADDAAQRVLSAELEPHGPLSEPAVARVLSAALPPGTHLHVSSSMPVRDLEWFGVPRDDLRVTANRGANGIDGVMSTAVGIALATRQPVAALVGDVAFLHDTNALLGLARRDVELLIVVVDNDGGGIFEFLPQATAVERERFELLFGTPHGVQLGLLAAAHAIAYSEATTVAELRAMAATGRGTRIVRVATDRRENVAVHARLNDAVSDALGA